MFRGHYSLQKENPRFRADSFQRRSAAILSFKHHRFFTALRPALSGKFLQTAKLSGLCPTLSFPRGRALAQFPKFVLEDKHRSIQNFNMGATDKEFWEVKSWSCSNVSVIPVFHCDGNLLVCLGTKLWFERFGIKDFQIQTSETWESADREVVTWKTVPDMVINWDGLPRNFFKISWNLYHSSLPVYQ